LELQELLSGIRAQQEAEEMEVDTTDKEEADKRPSIMQQIKFLLSPSILKPFFIGHIFNLFQILTGTMLVVFYAVDMISETDKNTTGVDSFTVAQLTAFVRLVFTLVTNSLLYFVRRRTHAIVATSVCAEHEKDSMHSYSSFQPGVYFRCTKLHRVIGSIYITTGNTSDFNRKDFRHNSRRQWKDSTSIRCTEH
jgi:hypothetical protein